MTTHMTVDRRRFAQSLAAITVAALAARDRPAFAQSGGAMPRIIDTHHHFLPPEYVRLVGRDAIGRPAPTGAPEWTVDRSLQVMDANGIGAAVVSISAPGIWFGDAGAARRLSRTCNDYAAQMVADHPRRFGFFAALPLPDAQGSIAEIEHAVEKLHCDGIGLITNYGNQYLGDRQFDPVFEELNRRALTVYVHPHVCTCDESVQSGIPTSMLEFPHSTTRAIVAMLANGTFTRYPNITFIFSHAGGTLPFLVNRILAQAKLLGREGWEKPLLRSYYDTAGSANKAAMGPLLQLVSTKQVLFGSDYPFNSAAGVAATLAGVRSLDLPEEDRIGIEVGNARRLLPRLA